MENILDIIESIAHEKGLSPENVKEAVKAAFIQTAKRLVNPEFAYDAEIDPQTKNIRVYQTITVVEDDDEKLEGEEAAAYIGLTRAKAEVDPDVEVGDEFQIEHDIESHGRTAAATLFR